MKKVLLKAATVIFAVLFVSSCAFHSGLMQNSASLSSANFTYVKPSVRGEASASYVFGFGGLGKQALVDQAKQKMIASYPLKSNQALSNITVNFKNTFILVFRQVKCTVTADIVEFK